MRRSIKENPVTTLFMIGFGIFIMVGYLGIVQPAKAERNRVVRDMCGEAVTYSEGRATDNKEQSKHSIYERTLLDN